MNLIKKNDVSLWIVTGLTLLYIFLLSSNNTIDSIAYSLDIRNGGELFYPHHLLFNAFGFVLSKLFGIHNTLSFICLINALFAGGCLWIMRRLLLSFTDNKTVAFILLFLGSCYGFARFATDAEAYIIPLFFALRGSKVIFSGEKIISTSLLLSISCLFHQLFVFWWIGLGIYIFWNFEKNRLRNSAKYISTALIVPAVYLIVFLLTKNDCNNLLEFIFHDYVKYSNVSISLNPTIFWLTPINFVRTFIQVHGYILPLLQNYFWILIPVVIAGICFFIGLFKLKGSITKSSTPQTHKYAFSHLLIFALQFLFAAISNGNAEFMLMLPFALAIFFFAKYTIKLSPVFYFSIGVFLWNLSLAIFPAHFLQTSIDEPMAKYIEQHSDKLYFFPESGRIDMLLEYQSPEKKYNIYNSKEELDSLIQTGNTVLTNAVNNKSFMSRGSLLDKNVNLFSDYKIDKVDSINYSFGTMYISKVE
ncbi:MAG: hypothetical protein FWD60_06780 [Candidatus Azobacteroides sp.]|nr:hypothetical protein [Candidatus Azobacteroides sp.]